MKNDRRFIKLAKQLEALNVTYALSGFELEVSDFVTDIDNIEVLVLNEASNVEKYNLAIQGFSFKEKIQCELLDKRKFDKLKIVPSFYNQSGEEIKVYKNEVPI